MAVMSRFDLSNRVAVVTGGVRGLGKAMALALAEAGADISIADISIGEAEEVRKQIRNIGRKSIAILADVTKMSQVEHLVDQTTKEFGKIDILVNNAGINKWAPTVEMSEETWDYVVDTDLKGVFLCSKEVGKVMIRQNKGAIINISSISGLRVNKLDSRGNVVPDVHYCSAKAGVIALTRTLALEWAKFNIRVNCISPGFFATEPNIIYLKKYEEAHKVWIEEGTPLKRMGDPSELGPLVVFLASDASSFMTGQNIVIDGGRTLW